MRSGNNSTVDRLVESAVRAAVAVAPLVGSGTNDQIDAAAVDSLRDSLGSYPWRLTVANCEGVKDDAPMLAVGETLGDIGESRDLVVDPVDGTSAVAEGTKGAIVALAIADSVTAIDFRAHYVEKLACHGPGSGAIDLSKSIEDNLRALSRTLGKPLASMRVAVLNRPRNQALCERVRALGAILVLEEKADLSATLAAVSGTDAIDLAAGISGTPETQVAAVAALCAGGRLLARQWPSSGERIFSASDLASGGRAVVAAGITENALTPAIKQEPTSRLVSVFHCEANEAPSVTVHRAPNDRAFALSSLKTE